MLNTKNLPLVLVTNKLYSCKRFQSFGDFWSFRDIWSVGVIGALEISKILELKFSDFRKFQRFSDDLCDDSKGCTEVGSFLATLAEGVDYI